MISKYTVVVLAGFGLLAGFSRELVIAYYTGTSVQSDIFRVAYSLPSFFINNLSPALISFYLFFLNKRPELIKLSFGVMSIFGLIISGVLFIFASEVGITLAPGFSDEQLSLLRDSVKILSGAVFLGFIIPFFRALLVYDNKPVLSSSFQAFIGFGFLLMAIVTSYINPSFLATDFSSFVILPLIIYSFVVILVSPKQNWVKSKLVINSANINFVLIFVVNILIFKVTNTIPRYFERGLLSYSDTGVISIYEYSLVLSGLLPIFLFAVFTNISLPSILRMEGEAKQRQEVFRLVVRSLFFILPITVILFSFREFFIDLTLGYGAFKEGDVEAVSEYFSISILAAAATFIYMAITALFIAQNMKSQLLILSLCKAGLRMLMSYYLYIEFSLKGIIVSFVLCEILMALLALYFYKKKAHDQ